MTAVSQFEGLQLPVWYRGDDAGTQFRAWVEPYGLAWAHEIMVREGQG